MHLGFHQGACAAATVAFVVLPTLNNPHSLVRGHRIGLKPGAGEQLSGKTNKHKLLWAGDASIRTYLEMEGDEGEHQALEVLNEVVKYAQTFRVIALLHIQQGSDLGTLRSQTRGEKRGTRAKSVTSSPPTE